MTFYQFWKGEECEEIIFSGGIDVSARDGERKEKLQLQNYNSVKFGCVLAKKDVLTDAAKTGV